MLVVLCRGDLEGGDLEVFGPFDDEEVALNWIDDVQFGGDCPNSHEIVTVIPTTA